MNLRKPQQSLKAWTSQKWRTKSGKPSTQGPKATGERYLPSAAIKALSPQEYAATTRAIRAGRREREVTIQDGENARQQLIADGVEVVDPTAEEIADWKTKTQAVYEKFEPTFTPGLIDKIKKS